VELEQIRAWFASNDSGRTEFKVGVVDSGIEKAKITGVKVVDWGMTDLRSSYYEAFREFFRDQLQDVEMRPRTEDYGDVWFKIYSPSLLPKGAYINHKSSHGFVNLTFPYTDAERPKNEPILESILEPDIEIEPTGKSAAIRILVPPKEDFRCFDDQRVSVKRAFSAAQRLLDFYTREPLRLEPALLDARTAANNQTGLGDPDSRLSRSGV
jgi:hypothetical protein